MSTLCSSRHVHSPATAYLNVQVRGAERLAAAPQPLHCCFFPALSLIFHNSITAWLFTLLTLSLYNSIALSRRHCSMT